MSNFVLTKQHLREILIFCFNWKKSAAEAATHRMLVEVYGSFMVTLLQLINHVGNDFDVSRMEISVLKTSFAPDSQKNLKNRQRIKGITRRRSESNARGACRSIGGNSTSHFCMIESYGNDSKTRKWVLYELKPRDVERRFFTCEQLIVTTADCDWR